MANATAINFMTYGKKDRGHGRFDWLWDWFGKDKGKDVMLVTGRFGLKTYDLSNPAKPKFLDEISNEELRLPGDPPYSPSNPTSTFWQNEDMDVDDKRKLALLSRDPRAFRGSTSRSPGEPDPNGATNIAGVYVIDAKDPADLKLLSFKELPTGHTTSCVNDCEWLWTGGPAPTTKQVAELGWTGGRPIIVTDLRDPKKPVSYPQKPVDLLRQDGVTAYAHDVDVDDAGIAWVAGLGGTRGYHTKGLHWDPVQRKLRIATPLDPVPYAGGGLSDATVGPNAGGWMHNSWRPIGLSAPLTDWRYIKGELLLGTEEDFGPGSEACRERGKFTISSLKGSYNGEGWRSTPEQPFRMEAVGSWAPADNEGTVYNLSSCSAHYFDVDGPLVTYAWYGQGTRFLDISNPANPIQVAYYRPDGGNVWASYLHKGYIYTADAARGVDVLRFKKGAKAASAARREVNAPKLSAAQQKFLAAQSSKWVPDPSTGGLCLLPKSEAVEADAVGGVGEAEALEGGEDVAAGGLGGAAFGQQAGELLVVCERVAGLGLDQAEDQQRDADDAGERVDAVVVVQEDRADLERLLVVAVAALDDLLVLVEARARGWRSGVRGGWSRARRSPSVRAAAAIASWSRAKVSVGRPARVAVVTVIRPLDGAGEDLRDARVDLAAGLVVAPAEAALDARERVLGLGQRALAGGGDLALLFGGVDVGDAQRERLAGLGVGDRPVAQRAAVARALRRPAARCWRSAT